MPNGETSGSASAGETQAPAVAPATAPRIASCPHLIVPVDEHNRGILHTGDGPCDVCCPWTIIISRRPRWDTGDFVPARYHEWIVYHLHVVTHQRLDRVIGPDLVA